VTTLDMLKLKGRKVAGEEGKVSIEIKTQQK
jgi:hypothetical protein